MVFWYDLQSEKKVNYFQYLRMLLILFTDSMVKGFISTFFS